MPSILATSDGGTSWTAEPYPGIVTNFTGISCRTHCTAPPSGCRRVDRVRSSHHGGRWQHLGAPDITGRGTSLTASHAERHNVPGHRPSSDFGTTDGGSAWKRPGNPARLHPPASRQLASARQSARRWWRSIPDQRERRRGVDEPGCSVRRRLAVRVACASPVKLRNRGDGCERRRHHRHAVGAAEASPPRASPSAPSGALRLLRCRPAADWPLRLVGFEGTLPPGVHLAPDAS